MCYNRGMNATDPHPSLQDFLQHHLTFYLDLLHQMVALNSFTLNARGVNAVGKRCV